MTQAEPDKLDLSHKFWVISNIYLSYQRFHQMPKGKLRQPKEIRPQFQVQKKNIEQKKKVNNLRNFESFQ